MVHERLIEKFVADLTPVEPLHQIRVYKPLLWMMSVALPLLAGTLLFVHGRRNIAEVFTERGLLLNEILALVAMTSAAYVVLKFRYPDVNSKLSARAEIAIGVVLLLILGAVAEDPLAAFVSGSGCTRDALVLAIVPFFTALYFVDEGACTHPAQVARWAALFAVSAAALVLPFSCPENTGLHLFLSHGLLPLLVISLLGSLIARFLLRW